MKPKVILLDVNETLLDMSPLQTKVNTLLKNEQGFQIWFSMVLHYSLVGNSTGHYQDFAAIAGATLHMAAKALKQEVNEQEKNDVLALTKKLPPHPDVKEGLTMLKEAGFRLATLTNSPPKTLSTQLQHAGLTGYFEQTLSIDAIRKYKPATEAYLYAAQTLAVVTNEVLMIAAHGWDIAGALQAHMQAAFIEREGKSLYPLSPKPQYTGKSLTDVASKIIESKN